MLEMSNKITQNNIYHFYKRRHNHDEESISEKGNTIKKARRNARNVVLLRSGSTRIAEVVP